MCARGASLCFQIVCEEESDESFEGLVDSYLSHMLAISIAQ